MFIRKKNLILILLIILLGIILGKIISNNISLKVNNIEINRINKKFLNINGKKFIAEPPQPLINGTLLNSNTNGSNKKNINTLSLIKNDNESYSDNTLLINEKENINEKPVITPNKIIEIPTLDLTKK